MILSRRGFFTGLAAGLGVLAAPAIIKTPGLLMPVKAQPLRYKQVLVPGFGRTGDFVSVQYANEAGHLFALTPEGKYVPIRDTNAAAWKPDGVSVYITRDGQRIERQQLYTLEREVSEPSSKMVRTEDGWAHVNPALDKALSAAIEKLMVA